MPIRSASPQDAGAILGIYAHYVENTAASFECAAYGKNLLFDKYDVDVFVDEEAVGSIEHGGEATYEFRLPEGRHGLFFKKKGSSVPEGRTYFFVESEGDKFFYRIYCTSEEIDVETYWEGTEGES